MRRWSLVLGALLDSLVRCWPRLLEFRRLSSFWLARPRWPGVLSQAQDGQGCWRSEPCGHRSYPPPCVTCHRGIATACRASPGVDRLSARLSSLTPRRGLCSVPSAPHRRTHGCRMAERALRLSCVVGTGPWQPRRWCPRRRGTGSRAQHVGLAARAGPPSLGPPSGFLAGSRRRTASATRPRCRLGRGSRPSGRHRGPCRTSRPAGGIGRGRRSTRRRGCRRRCRPRRPAARGRRPCRWDTLCSTPT